MRIAENANTGAIGSLTLESAASPKLERSVAEWSDARDTFVIVPRARVTAKPSGTTLLDDAWIGQPRAVSGSEVELITPAGLWLSPEQIGARYTADTMVLASNLSTLLDTLAPQGYVSETSASHSGTWTGDIRAGIAYRSAWASIAAEQDVAWRLDRRGRVRWGAEADVFATPTTLITDVKAARRERGYDVLPGGPVGHVRDSSQLAKGTIGIGPSDAVSGRIKVASGSEVVRFPNNAYASPWRTLDLSAVDNETTRQNLTDASAARFYASALPRIAFEVEVLGEAGYPLLKFVAAGDRVLVWSERYAVSDSGASVIPLPGGRRAQPRTFQVKQLTWSHPNPHPLIYRPNESDPWADWDALLDRVAPGNGVATLLVDSDLTPFQDPTDIGIAESPVLPLRTEPEPISTATSTAAPVNPYDATGRDLEAAQTGGGLVRDTTSSLAAVGISTGFVRG